MKIKAALLLCIASLLWITISMCSSETSTTDATVASAPGNTSIGVKWYGYDEGMALGKKEGKKIVLHFFADWCYYCKKMNTEIFSMRDVAEYMNQNFIPIRLNSDKEKQLSQEYRVSGLPTTWFMDQEGGKIQNIPGYIPKKMFLAYLKYIQTDSYQNMAFKQYMNAG